MNILQPNFNIYCPSENMAHFLHLKGKLNSVKLFRIHYADRPETEMYYAYRQHYEGKSLFNQL